MEGATKVDLGPHLSLHLYHPQPLPAHSLPTHLESFPFLPAALVTRWAGETESLA